MAFFLSDKSYIGIDLGTSSIKLVELKKEGDGLRLLTYGFIENLEKINNQRWQDDIGRTAKIINALYKKAGVISKNAVAALPTFSVFSSIINLSNVGTKDMNSAVQWQAKKVIPLPLEEMVLDWKMVPGADDKEHHKQNSKILLTGAPKALVGKYLKIFKEARINLLSLETETFSLIRCLLGNDKSTIMIIEIGTGTTDISVVSKSIPMLSRSIDIGGFTITKAISDNLNIGIERAEQFKCDLALSSQDFRENTIPKAITETIGSIINEIKYMLNLYQSKNNEKVEKIVLSGGSSLFYGLTDYLSKILNINVIVGDPWSKISYPVELKPVLSKLGPSLSVAIGLAMRKME